MSRQSGGGRGKREHALPCCRGMDTSLHDPQKGSNLPDAAHAMKIITLVMQNSLAMGNEGRVGDDDLAAREHC